MNRYELMDLIPGLADDYVIRDARSPYLATTKRVDFIGAVSLDPVKCVFAKCSARNKRPGVFLQTVAFLRTDAHLVEKYDMPKYGNDFGRIFDQKGFDFTGVSMLLMPPTGSNKVGARAGRKRPPNGWVSGRKLTEKEKARRRAVRDARGSGNRLSYVRSHTRVV
jgi:hypothetical protein